MRTPGTPEFRLPAGVQGYSAGYNDPSAEAYRFRMTTACWAQTGATRSPCQAEGNWDRIGLCRDHEEEILG